MEIRSAIQAGKEVTVHETPINAHGFTGYGYIITDPDTGAGAYLIEGRGNGGVLDNWSEHGGTFSAIIGIIAMFATWVGVSSPLILIFALIALLFATLNLMTNMLQRIDEGCKSTDFWPISINEAFAFIVGLFRIQGAGFSILWGAISAKMYPKNLADCRN